MLFGFLSIGTFLNPYNIPQAKDEQKIVFISSLFMFGVQCSFNVVICDLNFSKDHGKFALEINTLSCGYQIWCFFFVSHFISSCLVGTGGNLFSWFVQKDYKETNSLSSLSQTHTNSLSVKRLTFCACGKCGTKIGSHSHTIQSFTVTWWNIILYVVAGASVSGR